MSEPIHRYDMITGHGGGCMEKRDDGDWVDNEDYERLKSINAELLKAVLECSQATPDPPNGCDNDSFQVGYGAAFVSLMAAIAKAKQ